MTPQRKIEIILAVVVLAIAACFLKGWILEREARIRADATAAASAKVIEAKDQDIHNRDAANAQYSESLSRQAAAIQTPQQAARVIVSYLPTPAPVAGQPAPPAAPIPIVSREDLTPALQAELPQAKSYGILTDLQLKQEADANLACDADKHSLSTCAADKADLQAKFDAEKKRADGYEAAANGGTKFQRLVKVAKFVACAGAGSYVGAKADKSNPGTGAAIGGAAGVGACSLF